MSGVMIVVILVAVAWVTSIAALVSAMVLGFGLARNDPDTEKYGLGTAIAATGATVAWLAAIGLAGAPS